MGLRYFEIRVTDLERSLDFYVGLLGLKEQRRGKMRHGGVWVLLADPRTRQRLELNWYPQGSPYATRYVPGDGLDHIGFTAKDPQAVFDRLVSKGVEPALKLEGEGGAKGIYYVKDPDGNWIEFFG